MNNLPRITCQHHTTKPIIYLNLAKETHNTPRLLCSKCQLTLWKFGQDNLLLVDFDDFLNDPNTILDPAYNKTYIEFTSQHKKIMDMTIDEQQIDECLNNFASKMIDLLGQIKRQYKEQVLQFTILKKQIELVVTELSQRERHQQIQQLHNQILQQQLTHQSPQWKDLVANIDVMCEKISRLDDPIYLNNKLQIDKMMRDYKTIQPIAHLEHGLNSLTSKLKETLQCIIHGFVDRQLHKLMSQVNTGHNQSEAQLYRSLQNNNTMREVIYERSESLPVQEQDTEINLNTKLLPADFQEVIFKQIETNFHINKAQLIFSLKTEGKSFGSVWRSILSKSPTLLLIRVHTGRTIGAYSPVQWIENNEHVCDGHGQSFLFSVDRKEIYPLKSDFKGNAIYSFSDGSKMEKRIFQIGGADFLINSDFIIEYADLSAELQDIKQIDPELYLFNTKLAQVEEFEIYHLT